jgi:F-box and leucine-rich repeat protein GRR1
MSRRYSDGAESISSASTSPERDIDDDNDSIMMMANDSQSSLALSIPEELSDSLAREIAERCRVSPISRLPAELMISIFQKLGSSKDLKTCMLVSKEWARNSVGLLWHRPATGKWESLHNVVQSIRSAQAFFDYDHLVKRLNLSSLGPQVSDGTLLPFSSCKRIERLTLTGCTKLTDQSVSRMVDGNRSLLALDVTGMESVTDVTMETVANNCFRLQGLNITGCRKITDDSLINVARSCRHLKRLKFNECKQLTAKSIIAFATNCRQLLEIDLHGCVQVEDDAVTALINEGPHLRELRLAHCQRLTDSAFLNLPFDLRFESLRILDLTDCGELQDAGVQKIITAAPRLRNLVLAKCRQITDRAVVSITKLGKNLHYIHLGHCSRITDAGVLALVKMCTRIRYIDLACCSNLTDNSITQLATLPKLKRIGLVKCNAITDRTIYALAKPKPAETRGTPSPSSLERVHLSYCVNLTLQVCCNTEINNLHVLMNYRALLLCSTTALASRI